MLLLFTGCAWFFEDFSAGEAPDPSQDVSMLERVLFQVGLADPPPPPPPPPVEEEEDLELAPEPTYRPVHIPKDGEAITDQPFELTGADGRKIDVEVWVHPDVRKSVRERGAH